MERRGIPVLVPRLSDNGHTPYWRQHTECVANAMQNAAPEARMILVAHSGAGPLLPAIRAASPRVIAGYIFVDAGLPKSGASRLELFADENSDYARQFE